MKFYLGTHHPNWLGLVDVPLCVSRARLHDRHTFPRALGPYFLDSGAYSQLKNNREWTIDAVQYAKEIRRFADEIGMPDAVAPQDWMCEPHMVAKTGKTVREHQRRTVENYLDLRSLEPDLPVIPVLQGYTLAEYEHCAGMYELAGVDLAACPLVGLGSVCRRQNTGEIREIAGMFHGAGFRVHGFGVKTGGFAKYGMCLDSADSMAWSYHARRMQRPLLPGCTTHINCANCLPYALDWRQSLLEALVSRRSRV